ncbi:MAG: M3 family metallopeptidase [Candidatus Chromulinivorax sp.]
MKNYYFLGLLLLVSGCFYQKSPQMRLCSRLDWQSVIDIFPKSTHLVHQTVNNAIKVMQEMLHSLQHQSMQNPTFHNTVRLYDNAQFRFTTYKQVLSTIAHLHDDVSMRSAAAQAVEKLDTYYADHLVRNPILLHAFENYVQHGNDDQSKTAGTRSFLQKSIQNLEHEGANRSQDMIMKLHRLSHEIHQLEHQFLKQITHKHKVIHCALPELAGVPKEFIAKLEQKHNQYIVPLTYEAFFAILENCTNQQTRQKMFFAFNQRAYPENVKTLEKLCQKRNEYAQLIGYKNFAEYECSFAMIGSVNRASQFLYDVIEQINPIVQKEFAKLVVDLPASVTLSLSGKLYPWDEAFVKSEYRKKQYDINAAQVAEYFPIEHVLAVMQKQFEQFFALSFDQIDCKGLWHKDLHCIQVRRLKTSEILGYIVFDLYARDGKDQSAHQMSVIPALQDDCNLACSGLSVVVTNFVKAQDSKPTLLEFHDLKTLLHEFGHALHELFGSTGFVDLAGTKGPKDFVEVPSQLFEMWLDNPDMVALFSKHYQTGKPLSSAMISKILAAEKFGKASLLQRQCLLSLISLELGSLPAHANIHETVGKLYKAVRCDVEYDAQDYFETAFDHLVGYGSHYYSYVWSQVLAAGLFEFICKHGITNSKVGLQLYDALLSRGGVQDPHALIEMLLGTTVTKQALLNSIKA